MVFNPGLRQGRGVQAHVVKRLDSPPHRPHDLKHPIHRVHLDVGLDFVGISQPAQFAGVGKAEPARGASRHGHRRAAGQAL